MIPATDRSQLRRQTFEDFKVPVFLLRLGNRQHAQRHGCIHTSWSRDLAGYYVVRGDFNAEDGIGVTHRVREEGGLASVGATGEPSLLGFVETGNGLRVLCSYLFLEPL